MENTILPTKNTWCIGCANFGIQNALKTAIETLGKEKLVLVSGIGCHGKMADHLNVNSFYALHGRAIPVGVGIKLANEDLNVICSVGDGDTYNEGIAHLVHSARRNSNITVIVHDNQVFSLTVKQATATSPEGFLGTTTPQGNPSKPLNPLRLMLSSNATFVARGYAGKTKHLTELILEGVRHKGFSFIEVLQPCVAWNNTYDNYNKNTYEMESTSLSFEDAFKKAGEWDYNSEAKISLGVFWKEKKKTFEERIGKIFSVEREVILEDKK